MDIKKRQKTDCFHLRDKYTYYQKLLRKDEAKRNKSFKKFETAKPFDLPKDFAVLKSCTALSVETLKARRDYFKYLNTSIKRAGVKSAHSFLCSTFQRLKFEEVINSK